MRCMYKLMRTRIDKRRRSRRKNTLSCSRESPHYPGDMLHSAAAAAAAAAAPAVVGKRLAWLSWVVCHGKLMARHGAICARACSRMCHEGFHDDSTGDCGGDANSKGKAKKEKKKSKKKKGDGKKKKNKKSKKSEL